MIKNYSDFAQWHQKNYGNQYRTPSREQAIAEYTSPLLHRSYDAAADNFTFRWGQYHPTLAGQIGIETWQDVADNYARMYDSFAQYGTN